MVQFNIKAEGSTAAPACLALLLILFSIITSRIRAPKPKIDSGSSRWPAGNDFQVPVTPMCGQGGRTMRGHPQHTARSATIWASRLPEHPLFESLVGQIPDVFANYHSKAVAEDHCRGEVWVGVGTSRCSLEGCLGAQRGCGRHHGKKGGCVESLSALSGILRRAAFGGSSSPPDKLPGGTARGQPIHQVVGWVLRKAGRGYQGGQRRDQCNAGLVQLGAGELREPASVCTGSRLVTRWAQRTKNGAREGATVSG